MLSVTHPPFLFNSSWYTRSLSRSSRVPFLSFSEYRRSLSCRSAYVLFLFSSLSRISAFFLSNSFCWCINNSGSRECPTWILRPFIQALVWPRGFWIDEKCLPCPQFLAASSAFVNCKAKDISIKFAYSDYSHIAFISLWPIYLYQQQSSLLRPDPLISIQNVNYIGIN